MKWAAALLALFSAQALAADALTLVLNWVPGGDHAPFFLAQSRGWYRDAGIDLTIDSVGGSPDALKRVAQERSTLAVADFVPFVREAAKRKDVAAIMALQPRSPYAIYFSTQSEIRQADDLVGKRLGAQPQDPMRLLWRALATRNGIATDTWTWVDRSNAMKPDALQAGEIDAALNPFLHNHLNYEAALGERMRVLWWHDLGFSAPGHVLVAGRAMTSESPDLLHRFVRVTQRAWRDCMADPAPCVDALLVAHPHLERGHEQAVWLLATQLQDRTARNGAVGAFGDEQASSAVRLISDALALPLTERAIVTNAFLDPAIVYSP